MAGREVFENKNFYPSMPGYGDFVDPPYEIDGHVVRGGGGWAVNAYLPKEVGIISLSRQGVLSIFAHELAHTMGGPPNDKGELAGSHAPRLGAGLDLGHQALGPGPQVGVPHEAPG